MISFDSPTTTAGVVPCKLVPANSRGSPSSQPGPESLTSKTLKQRLNGDNEHPISGKRVDESLSREERESTVNRPESQVIDPNPRDNGLKRVFTACKSAIQSKTAPIVNRFVPKGWRLTAHKRQMRKELEMNDIPYKIVNRKGKWVPTLVIREVKEELNKTSEKEDSPELNEGSVKESEPEIAQVETREDPKQAPNQIDQDHLKPLERALAEPFTENEVTGVESQNNETVVEEHSLQCQQKDQIMSESLAAENKIITDTVQHLSVQELADIESLIENMIACLAANNQISAHSVQQELSDKEVTLKQDMMGSVAADKPTSSTLKPREEEVRHSSIEEQKVSEQNEDNFQHLEQPLAQVVSQKDGLVENKTDHKSMAAQSVQQCLPSEQPIAVLTNKEVTLKEDKISSVAADNKMTEESVQQVLPQDLSNKEVTDKDVLNIIEKDLTIDNIIPNSGHTEWKVMDYTKNSESQSDDESLLRSESIMSLVSIESEESLDSVLYSDDQMMGDNKSEQEIRVYSPKVKPILTLRREKTIEHFLLKDSVKSLYSPKNLRKIQLLMNYGMIPKKIGAQHRFFYEQQSLDISDSRRERPSLIPQTGRDDFHRTEVHKPMRLIDKPLKRAVDTNCFQLTTNHSNSGSQKKISQTKQRERVRKFWTKVEKNSGAIEVVKRRYLMGGLICTYNPKGRSRGKSEKKTDKPLIKIMFERKRDLLLKAKGIKYSKQGSTPCRQKQ